MKKMGEEETKKEKKKPITECEETIIRGMKMNIENKTAVPNVNPMKVFEKNSSTYQNTPFENLQDVAFGQIEKEDIFYNKHNVHSIHVRLTTSRSTNEDERFDRMFEFGDIKSKWEQRGRK